jgi:hypothetical protein
MRVRDMHGRAQIAVEFLDLRESEWIGERGEFRLGETLRHEAQQRGRFRECTALGDQGGYSPLGIDREVFGAPLALRAEVYQNRLVGRAGLFERDVRRERARAGGVVKRQHDFCPLIGRAPIVAAWRGLDNR